MKSWSPYCRYGKTSLTITAFNETDTLTRWIYLLGVSVDFQLKRQGLKICPQNGETGMQKQTSLCLIAAVVSTIVITGMGLLIAAMSSMTTAGTGGISAVAGGVSQNVFLLLMISAPVLLVLLFLIFRKVLGSRS